MFDSKVSSLLVQVAADLGFGSIKRGHIFSSLELFPLLYIITADCCGSVFKGVGGQDK